MMHKLCGGHNLRRNWGKSIRYAEGAALRAKMKKTRDQEVREKTEGREAENGEKGGNEEIRRR